MKAIYSIFLLFIFLTPLASAQTVSIGDIPTALDTEFAVPINITDAELIAGGVVNVSFNPSIIHVEIVTAGDFGSPMANINNTNGWVKLVAARIDKVNKSPAVLANIVLRRISIGQTGVYISYASLNDEFGQLITPGYENGRSVGQGAPDLAIQNHFIDAYNRNGGINVLGSPATEVHRAWGYLVQDFPGANGYGGGIIIYNTYQKYAYYIHSEIWERYYGMGGANAKTNLNFWLGPPTSDIEPYVHLLPPEKSKYGTPFRYQKFEGGNLELNVTSGKVFEVHGGILQKWRELGYAASNMGLPTTDEREAAVSKVSGLTGRYSVFEGGIIHWIRETNEIFVIGLNQPEGKKIADKYYAEGGSGGWLGFPVSNDYVNTSGYLQVNCEGGYITTSDGINYVAYPKDITKGPTIIIESPSNGFSTNNYRIDISGSAYSENGIKSISININSENRINRGFGTQYNSLNQKWTTNIPLEYGLNLIEVTAFDTNSIHSSDTIQVYSNPPDFSFAHITDVHMGNKIPYLSPLKIEERERRITKALSQIKYRTPKSDFILITGDLVDFSKDEYFKKFNNIFKNVKAYIVPGNHDRRIDLLIGNEGLNNYSTYIQNPPKNINYIDNNKSFIENGYLFIGLDSGSDYDPWQDVDLTPEGTGLEDKQMVMLKSFDYTTPKIIFMHNPVINTKNDVYTDYICNAEHICTPPVPPGNKNIGNDATLAENRIDFIDYSIKNNVQLVLTGHTHEDLVFKSDGSKVDVKSEERPLFIQTPSVIDDKPNEHGYRYIDIRDGKAYAKEYTKTELASIISPDSIFMLTLACPANLHVYDSQGRHTGLNSSGGIETNIPDSFYIGRYNASDPDDAETIFLYNATEEYRFEIIANLTEEQKNSPENESFNFTMDRQSEGIRTIESFQNITLNENTTATLQVNITTENPKMILDYNGDTITDESKYPNYIETNYAPTAAIITPEIGSIYNQSAIVEFNGTGRDPEDGILTNRSLVWYSDIDGFIGSGERFSTVNLSAGSHIITLMVNDSMYLYGASSMTITIADTAPPVTTLIPSGMLGNNSWFISDVNVTLTATDTQTGSGVNITEYSFDNATWTTYFIRFNITSEGITTVYYRSTDNLGNEESIKNQTIKIDKTLPSSIINPLTIAGSTYINFTWFNPTDPDFSHVMLYLNGTLKTSIPAPQNYYNFTGLDPDTLYELGTHTVDRSGNVNETWVNATGRTLPPNIEKINFTLPLKIGWNMVSLPIIPDNPSVIAIFGSNVTTVYGWTGTSYGLRSTLEPKNGYWVLSSSNYNITVTGRLVVDRNITLTNGWNMVGPVTNGIMVSSLQNVTTVYEWTGTSYNIVSGSNTLTLTKGYWILGNATSTIQI